MLASPVLAGSALADSSTRLGDAYFMAIGPAVIFLAVILWVAVTLMASRRPPHRPGGRASGLPHRGPVQGGVIAGSPSQRTRRDPAPSVTRQEVIAHVEAARADEQQPPHERQPPHEQPPHERQPPHEQPPHPKRRSVSKRKRRSRRFRPPKLH
ncbi:hypothetical protein [Actinomadura sp. 9N215]|uniref:hypothetical protein n=1 Tax=Actinomadura sp. 9N215 TaxID=3375150 RepID=UPI0037AEFE13